MALRPPHSAWFLGTAWYLGSVLASNLNDVLTKALGQGLPGSQVTCLRFLLSALLLFPWIAVRIKRNGLPLRAWKLHVVRGSLLAISMGFWTVGLAKVPITLATALSFAVPLFTLPLATAVLGEKVSKAHWIATMGGFLGVLIVIKPQGHWQIEWPVVTMVIAAFLFATQDIINKRFVHRESMLEMVFYLAAVAAVLWLWPAMKVWVNPRPQEWLLLLGLGCGANLILLCLLKAFWLAQASFLAPLRYTEILMSAALGWVIFGEVPTRYTLLGSSVIIACALYITLSQARVRSTAGRGSMTPKPADALAGTRS